MVELIDESAADITNFESALITLIKKNYDQPAKLVPDDLKALREIVGDDVLDYVLVITGFHFINRIADLLDVPPDAMPRSLRGFEFLRRISVRITGMLMKKMDLKNRSYPVCFDDALGAAAPSLASVDPDALADALKALKPRPKIIEALQMALEERDVRSSLMPEVIAKIHRTVEAALPAALEDTERQRTIPEDPVEAFAFVGTRYAYRTTTEHIDKLRKLGYDDLGVMDLAIAVADANQWARFYRMVGLDPGLFYRI